MTRKWDAYCVRVLNLLLVEGILVLLLGIKKCVLVVSTLFMGNSFLKEVA